MTQFRVIDARGRAYGEFDDLFQAEREREWGGYAALELTIEHRVGDRWEPLA